MSGTVACVNGHENPEGQQFCGTCGVPLKAPEEVASPWKATADSPSSVQAGTPAPPPKRTLNPLVLIGAGLAIVVIGLLVWLVLLSRGGTGPLAEKHTISGSLTAPECAGGYDIENAAVELRNENNKLIGSTTTGLDQGTISGMCTVEFTISDVPKASFYQVTVGSHSGPSYSYQEMKSSGWRLDLSLGA